MNCQEFWNSENPNHSEHLKECSDCAAAWARQQAVAAGLQCLAEEWRRGEAPARLESQLVAAFRIHGGSSPLRPRRHLAIVAGLSAAAVLVLGAFLFVRTPEQPKPVRRVSPTAVQLAGAEAPAAFEESDGFIPLPNAAQVEADEEVNLVRVEVPRSAMIALGYDVSPDRAFERISADVMLGADGLVRAVRFLED
jgi:hypothetical protein